MKRVPQTFIIQTHHPKDSMILDEKGASDIYHPNPSSIPYICLVFWGACWALLVYSSSTWTGLSSHRWDGAWWGIKNQHKNCSSKDLALKKLMPFVVL